MTIGQLIEQLRRLPPDSEVAVLTAAAHARPPTLVRVNQFAWSDGASGLGLQRPDDAYLIRPENEVI